MTYNPGPDPYRQPYGQQSNGQPPSWQQPINPPPTRAYGPAEQYPAPQRRAAPWAWMVLAAVVAAAAGVGYWVYSTKIRKDSGVEACKTLRAGQKLDGVSRGNKTLTEANYRKARQVFADSRYDDIRAAGTKMMDVVWQIYQLGPDAGMGALAYMGQMTSATTELQGACANHGIVINLTSTGTPTPTATS